MLEKIKKLFEINLDAKKLVFLEMQNRFVLLLKMLEKKKKSIRILKLVYFYFSLIVSKYYLFIKK